MRLCRNTYQFGLIFCLVFFLAPLAGAQMAMPGRSPVPGRSEASGSDKKPIQERTVPVQQFSRSKKEALKRSKEKGVLQASRAESGYIFRIKVVGMHRVEKNAVLLRLKSNVGTRVKEHTIQEDIRSIFAMGLFDDVAVYEERGPNSSVELIFAITEKPTIQQIKFEGNQAIPEEDLKSSLTLKSFHVADEFQIRQNAEKIKKAYSDKGYFLTSVRFELKPALENKVNFVDVVFLIDEGAKVKIKDIAFLGNKKLSSDDIRTHIQSREEHPLGLLTKWGTFNEDAFAIDQLLIEQYYHDNGYLNVQVQKPRIHISGDKTELFIKVPLVEGEQFRIGNMDFDGDFVVDTLPDSAAKTPVFLRSKLKSKITLQDGDVFNRTKLMREVLSVADMYRDEGYAYVNIVPQTRLDEREKKVDVVLKVESGPEVFFGRIDIKGNTTTTDAVIRRELRIYEGEKTSSALMRLSEMRVRQLGFFETVKFNSKPSGKKDSIDIEIIVKEKKTGSTSLGMGYGTGGEGFLIQGQISQNNLFGRGQSLSGTVQWSNNRRFFDLRFATPYLFYAGEQPVSFSFSLYNLKRVFGEYTRKSTGGDFTFGYPIGAIFGESTLELLKSTEQAYEVYVPDFENLKLYLTYSVERVETNDNSLLLSLQGLHTNQTRYNTSLKPVLQFDQRDNRIAPTAGYFLEFRYEWVSPFLGAGPLADVENYFVGANSAPGLRGGLNYLKPPSVANDFMRYGFNTRIYYNFDEWFPLKGWVLKMNVDLGVLDTFGDLIVSENYRLGGVSLGLQSGLRGYFYQSVGPVLNVAREYLDQRNYEFVVGGNKQFLFNLELEFPILKMLNVSGVLFFDMGNVYNYDENFFHIGQTQKQKAKYAKYNDPLGVFSTLGLYASAGFGFRWLSPFGPLRFEFGFPLVKRPAGTPGMQRGDGVMQFEFNMGTSF